MERESFKTAKLPIFSAVNNKVDDLDPTSVNLPTIENAFVETLVDSFSGNGINYVSQRPSFSLSNTLTHSTAGYNHAYYPYVNMGAVIYKQVFGTAGTTVWTGTNTTTTECSKFTLVRDTINSEDILVFVEGNTGKLVTIDLGTDVATEQTAAPDPANPFIASLNGYTFVAMDGTDEIYNSDLNDITSWNLGVNFIRSSTSPGHITALQQYKNYIVAFKDTSCEFFYDAGLTGTSPLQRNENLSLGIGCPAPWTLVSFEDKLVFQGKGGAGNSNGVYVLSGEKLEKISTPAIDRMLLWGGTNLTSYKRREYGAASVAKLNGNTFYILSVREETKMMVYCFETKQWSTWSSHTQNGIIYDVENTFAINSKLSNLGFLTFYYDLADGASGVTPSTGVTRFGAFHPQQLSYDIVDSVNIPIVIKVRTPQVDFGTAKRKIISCMRWLGTIVTGKNVRCSWSDDNQTTTSSNHVFPIGTNPTIRNLGQFRRREFTFEFVNVQDINTPNTESTTLLPRIRMEGIEVEYREGTN